MGGVVDVRRELGDDGLDSEIGRETGRPLGRAQRVFQRVRVARRRAQPEVAAGADRGGWRVVSHRLRVGPGRALGRTETQAGRAGVEPQAALRQRRIGEDCHARDATGAAADAVDGVGLGGPGVDRVGADRRARAHTVPRLLRKPSQRADAAKITAAAPPSA